MKALLGGIDDVLFVQAAVQPVSLHEARLACLAKGEPFTADTRLTQLVTQVFEGDGCREQAGVETDALGVVQLRLRLDRMVDVAAPDMNEEVAAVSCGHVHRLTDSAEDGVRVDVHMLTRLFHKRLFHALVVVAHPGYRVKRERHHVVHSRTFQLRTVDVLGGVVVA